MSKLTTLHLPSGPLTIEQTPPTGALIVDPRHNEWPRDTQRRESQVRVQSALARLPLDRVTVYHLRVVEGILSAPADLALALLAMDRADLAVRAVAELSLGGDLRSARGFFAFARAKAQSEAPAQLITAEGPDARHAAALLGERTTYVASTLQEVLDGQETLVRERAPVYEPSAVQAAPRRLLLTIPAQGHGAVLRARALHDELPPIGRHEHLGVADAQSRAGILPETVTPARPFRAPHHTCSVAGLVGKDGRPGEAQLARHGTLVLDELSEFKLQAIEALAAALTPDVQVIATHRLGSEGSDARALRFARLLGLAEVAS